MTVSVDFEIDASKAFRILCDVLHMTSTVGSEDHLVIHNGKVCKKLPNGEYKVVDDRADLFAALRNVANCLFPGCEFRSDPYITDYSDDDVITNGDVLRQMNNRTLATFLSHVDCSMCSIHDTEKFDTGECANDHDLCVLGMTEWLGQEAGSIMKSYIE